MRSTLVTAPTDKRFRRAQAKPGHRRRWFGRRAWRLLRGLLLFGGFVYAGYRAGALLVHTPGLQVQRIVIHGNNRLSNGEVLALLDGLTGQNALLVDLDTWRERVLDSPWVADASLRRVLPSTIEVRITERHPIGLGRMNGSLYLVDDEGTVVDEYAPKYAELDLPLIDGLAAAQEHGRRAIDPDRSSLAVRLLADVKKRPDVARRISQIDVSDPHDAVVILENDVTDLRVGEDAFLERLQSYLELAPALHERVPAIDYVDLRFGDRVYVGPGTNGGRAGAPRHVAAPRAPGRIQ